MYSCFVVRIPCVVVKVLTARILDIVSLLAFTSVFASVQLTNILFAIYYNEMIFPLKKLIFKSYFVR